ncbi:MAG: glycosyltransferase family 2 protein [Acidobacteria bacterium]|nr:MAG: glycosyltransferase family 2 protein [Acidobacteriota bacterium]
MISVLIVSHQSRRHLERCLRSLPPVGDGLEVIVADNASSDGSAELARRVLPAATVLELGENAGFGAANNRAAAAARGDRLLLLNPDAELEPGCLERLAAALDADPRLGLVAPQLRYPDGRRQFVWAPETGVLGEALQMVRNPFEDRAWNHRLVPPLLRLLTGPGWFTAACVLLRRSAFDAAGGFDESFFLYFEDVDLCRRLRRAGWRLRLVPEARARHVKGAISGGTAYQLGYRRSQLRYYRKHRPAWEYRLLRFKLRHKFRRLPDPDLRARLLALLEDG